MKTSVIGYPRIGTLRELKFASEKYFRKEITSVELLDTAKSLREIHWNTQKSSGIDFISSNDFSFYDTLKEKIENGLPVFGTCAGLLLLAKSIDNDNKTHLATMDITAMRNAYGKK